jgi:hypothetical protein
MFGKRIGLGIRWLGFGFWRLRLRLWLRLGRLGLCPRLRLSFGQFGQLGSWICLQLR